MKTNKFTQDFTSHTNFLRAYALKLTRDRNLADDLYQETALKAFKNKNTFKENTNMKGWLSTIMKNSFINYFRKNKRNKVFTSKEDYLLNYAEKTDINNGEININVAEINRMIYTLEDGIKRPFIMAYQGYQYNEIQEAMGNLPMGTIKSRIHQARKILKHQITQTFDEVAN
jgi:RNA polymerase sigma factor (sigma-70 family)